MFTLFFSAVRSFTIVSRVWVSDAIWACVLSFMRTSGNRSLARYSARFRASLGSVFFTECVITLNWLGFTATIRSTCGATASWNSRVLPVTSTATSSVRRSLAVNFVMSSSFHCFKYSLPFSNRRHAVKQFRCRSIPM